MSVYVKMAPRIMKLGLCGQLLRVALIGFNMIFGVSLKIVCVYDPSYEALKFSIL